MTIKVEGIFKKAGYNWKDMDIGEEIDISNKNIMIKSFNENTQELEYKKIKSIIRKKNTKTYKILNNENKELFRASSEHKLYVFNNNKFEYLSLSKLNNKFICLNDKGDKIDLYKEETNKEEPILDFSIEDNKNYFANGILSHNTTPGGRGLKFFSSIRIEVRRVDSITQNQEVIGLKSRIKAVKNKTAPPYRKGEFEILFGKGIQFHKEYVDFAVKYNIIEKSASWFSIKDDKGNEIEKVQGTEKVVEYLQKNKEFYESLKNKVNSAMNAPKTSNDTDGIDDISDVIEE